MKCKKPLVHRPEFEGTHNCKHCERETIEKRRTDVE